MLLTCTKCGEVKPEIEFPPAPRPTGRVKQTFANGHVGRNSQCRVCRNKAGRAWHATHRAERAAGHRKYSYGLTQDQYEGLVDAVGGRCPICGKEAELHVDHDHDSGAVRGVLCGVCNRGLGHFKDDPERLLRAVAYLRSIDDMVSLESRLHDLAALLERPEVA